MGFPSDMDGQAEEPNLVVHQEVNGLKWKWHFLSTNTSGVSSGFEYELEDGARVRE